MRVGFTYDPLRFSPLPTIYLISLHPPLLLGLKKINNKLNKLTYKFFTQLIKNYLYSNFYFLPLHSNYQFNFLHPKLSISCTQKFPLPPHFLAFIPSISLSVRFCIPSIHTIILIIIFLSQPYAFSILSFLLNNHFYFFLPFFIFLRNFCSAGVEKLCILQPWKNFLALKIYEYSFYLKGHYFIISLI